MSKLKALERILKKDKDFEEKWGTNNPIATLLDTKNRTRAVELKHVNEPGEDDVLEMFWKTREDMDKPYMKDFSPNRPYNLLSTSPANPKSTYKTEAKFSTLGKDPIISQKFFEGKSPNRVQLDLMKRFDDNRRDKKKSFLDILFEDGSTI